jgi:hypothetical protein
MQVLIIHDTDTEDIVGMVTPLDKVNFDKFQDDVYTSWISFNSNPENVEDYSIEDFVDFHNLNSGMEIDWVVSDYIQL